MIQVFSNDGVFLRSFRCDGKGEKKVKSPCGLCVSGHYVYVCNYGSYYNISVFITDGVYVTSFGQCSSNSNIRFRYTLSAHCIVTIKIHTCFQAFEFIFWEAVE